MIFLFVSFSLKKRKKNKVAIMLVLDEKHKEFEGEIVPYEATSPGDILYIELEAREITNADFAIMTRIPLDVIEDFIAGKIPVTEELAEKLEKALGIDAQYWLRSQRFHEYCLLVLAERAKQKKQKKQNGFFEAMGKVAAL